LMLDWRGVASEEDNDRMLAAFGKELG
jgi:hypothetical protein